MKQIEINGLLWDTENLEIQGKKYFTWQEAMDAAKSVGKRLPTKEELEALIDAGWEWDEEKKGMWMADRKLFSPLSGYLNYASGALPYTDYGYLWSSSPKDDSYSWRLDFTGGAAYMGNGYATHGFPVRCVQDIQSDNSQPISTKEIDWEQRRYEVAKDYFCYNKGDIEGAIQLATEFIKRLKNKGNV